VNEESIDVADTRFKLLNIKQICIRSQSR
jgi:hypothetical protein